MREIIEISNLLNDKLLKAFPESCSVLCFHFVLRFVLVFVSLFSYLFLHLLFVFKHHRDVLI